MRTTLSIDDDVLQDVKSYADSRSLSLGKAASDLIRRGLSARTPTKLVNGIPIFDLPPDTPAVSSEHVKKIEAEMDKDEWSRS